MTILITEQFECDADQLWAIVGTPDRVDWVPGVKDCFYDGEVRTLFLPGAGKIKERILDRNAESRTMSYSCFDSPVPLESHLASIEVRPNAKGCELVWETTVIPEVNEPFIKQSKMGALVQIASILENIS